MQAQQGQVVVAVRVVAVLPCLGEEEVLGVGVDLRTWAVEAEEEHLEQEEEEGPHVWEEEEEEEELLIALEEGVEVPSLTVEEEEADQLDPTRAQGAGQHGQEEAGQPLMEAVELPCLAEGGLLAEVPAWAAQFVKAHVQGSEEALRETVLMEGCRLVVRQNFPQT